MPMTDRAPKILRYSGQLSSGAKCETFPGRKKNPGSALASHHQQPPMSTNEAYMKLPKTTVPQGWLQKPKETPFTPMLKQKQTCLQHGIQMPLVWRVSFSICTHLVWVFCMAELKLSKTKVQSNLANCSSNYASSNQVFSWYAVSDFTRVISFRLLLSLPLLMMHEYKRKGRCVLPPQSIAFHLWLETVRDLHPASLLCCVWF